MSKIMRMAALVLVLILAVGSAAAAAYVEFDWQSSKGRHGFAFTPVSTDLFENFKNLMPGDVVSQEITVKNTWHNPVRIWLAADPEVAEEYQDFLSQLNLTVTVQKGKTIFEAAASEQDGLAPTEKSPYGVLLGTFSKKGSVKLTATLEVPIELSNDYMGQYGEIPWLFTAEEVVIDSPDTGDDFTMWVWIAVAGVLVISLLWLLLGRKKQKEA